MSALPRVGVVGTGRMGANIAKRLHDVGYSIVVLYDVNAQSAAGTAAKPGAKLPDSRARHRVGRRGYHGR